MNLTIIHTDQYGTTGIIPKIGAFTDWKNLNAGAFNFVYDKATNLANTKKAYILVNQFNAQTATFIAIGGGRTSQIRCETVFHELLGEGLFWKNDPKGSIYSLPRSQQVHFQNIIYKIFNSPERDGLDH